MKNNSKEITGVIYKFQNKLNNKIYIGQTISPIGRYEHHIFGNNSKRKSLIDLAIMTDGRDNFKYDIIFSISGEKLDVMHQLKEKEAEFINQYNCTYPNGYNETVKNNCSKEYRKRRADKVKNAITYIEHNDEVWKDVVGYEGIYKVSNYGMVKSVDRYITYSNGMTRIHYGRYLRQLDIYNYKAVNLNKNGKVKVNARIHRIVAEAFIPNPNNLPYVNHIDENPKNNHVDNLEWCDCKYNNNYKNHNLKVSNSQKGMVNINNGERIKRIKPTDILPDGWEWGNGNILIKNQYNSKTKENNCI